jgi:repressor LexA
VSDLTDRQREVHAFIVRYGREHARWPTIRDIGKHFGWTAPNAALCHLRALENKGYIERLHDHTSRGIRVLKGVDGEALGSACPHCGGKL